MRGETKTLPHQPAAGSFIDSSEKTRLLVCSSLAAALLLCLSEDLNNTLTRVPHTHVPAAKLICYARCNDFLG